MRGETAKTVTGKGAVMRRLTIMLVLGAALFLAACAKPESKFRSYDGPEVTSIIVHKSTRELWLLHDNQVMRSVPFELGFAPVGHKQVERDGRTPEGAYRIDRRNPNSQYHLSLGISYPNTHDREVARALGMPPGGDIFIHGTPRSFIGKDDWTAGCIAVSDEEMEIIYAMVKDGTPIFIYP
jgi:murein L,D-transpeptidase YafK